MRRSRVSSSGRQTRLSRSGSSGRRAPGRRRWRAHVSWSRRDRQHEIPGMGDTADEARWPLRSPIGTDGDHRRRQAQFLQGLPGVGTAGRKLLQSA